MRFSLIGAGGFIGKALGRVLKAAGHEVHTPSKGEFVPPKGGWGRVVWAAGLTANFRQRPLATVQAHVSDLERLLRGGELEALLYLSSTRVYLRSSVTNEEVALPCLSSHPSDLYNLSKLMGEALSLSLPNLPVQIARLSNIVGPGEAQRSTFIGALCREAQQGQIRMQSALYSSKDYLWIDDCIKYLAKMAQDDTTGIFNVASGKQTTHAEWAHAIAVAYGAQVRHDPNDPDGGFAPIAIKKLHAMYGPSTTDPLTQIDAIIGTSND